jgi:aminoglycoside 3-N-acetyltransferase
MIHQAQIVDAIRALGVREGDVVLCHSSYKSFGDDVDGGPAGVGHALIEAAGTGGSVFVPTFNFAQLPWIPGETASLTGVITDHFWRLPGVLRSLHPTHPVAGTGPIARDVLEGHDRTHPFGEGSPVWKLWKRGAWVLQLGVEHSSNSTVHVGEEENRLPYVVRTRRQKVWDGGKWTDVTLRRPGDSNGFVKVGPVLERMGAVREVYVGRSRFRLMRSGDVMRAVAEMVARDTGALLCDDPSCERCAEARRMIAEAGV